MPEVSVLIPNYNHASYLKQRIDSVLNQTYQDFELIILDDCSPDNSRDVIENYRDHPKVTSILYNTENSGSTFKQWDKGIKAANGKYVWIAESDDWCEITLLETLVAGIKKQDDCAIAYCQSYCITDGQRIKFQSNHPFLEDIIDGKTFLKDYIMPRNPIFNAGMAIWRKDFYDKISKDFINYKIIGDYYFWIELSTCGSVFISGKLLNYFRTHEKNVSVNGIKNGKVYIEHLPLLKHLLNRQIINQDTYLHTLKKLYISFRVSESGMSEENVMSIKKLFSDSSINQSSIKSHFFQKKVQNYFRKLIRV